MAIAFRSAGTKATSESATFTLTAPAGVLSTDVVLAVMCIYSGTATINPPAGWTLVNRTNFASNHAVAVYWALGDVASYAFNDATSLATKVGYTLAYSGVDNAAPIDISDGQTNAASATLTAPSITTTVANDLLVGVFGWHDVSGGAAPTFSAFFGTERGPSGAAAGVGANYLGISNGDRKALDVAELLQPSIGASGTKTVTASGTAKPSIGVLLALRPAGGGGGGSGPSFDSTGFDSTVFYVSNSGTVFTQSLAGTLTSSGSLSKLTFRSLTATLTSVGSITKQTSRTLTAALASSGALAKQAQKSFAGTLTNSGALTQFKVALASVAGTLTSAGALVKKTSKSFAGTLTSAGTLAKQIQKTFAGSMASAGALVKQTNRALTASLTSSATLASVKAALKSIAGTLTSSGTLVRLPNKALAGTVTSAGAIVKKTAKGIAGVLTPVGTLSKQIRRGLSGVLSFIGTFVGSTSAQPVFGAPLSGRQDAPGLTGKQDAAAAVTGKQDQDALKGTVN